MRLLRASPYLYTARSLKVPRPMAGQGLPGPQDPVQSWAPLGGAVPRSTPGAMTEDFPGVLARARKGDEAAFTALFRALQPVLLRYLRTMARDLADDVAAETWVSVVRGLPRFRGDLDGFRAWVFTIARSRLIDARRTTGRLPQPVGTNSELTDRPDGTDVSAVVDELMSTEAALALIGRLAPDQAEAVLLRHVVGLDVAQTARVLDKRPGAVRIATLRGLRRLRTLIEEDERGMQARCNAPDRASG
jgi:RNA polymerase sigma-70 factor, ECF subfamily